MLFGRGPEPLHLLLRVGGVAVGGGEVAHHPDDLPGRRGELGKTPPPHARVELEVDADALGNLTVDDHELEAGVACLGDLATRSRAHDEDAHGAERPPQHEPLRHGRDAERRRAAPERGGTDVGGAVAVAVGLDHRPQLRPVERAEEPPRIAADRTEIDRQLRAGHDPMLRATGSASRRS